MGLTDKQKEIVEATGKVVVDACPGSGKTYSVAVRIADLLEKREFNHQGIAAISFTNVAWKEISEELEKSFRITTPLPFPHFLGTIDSFVNQYIFLPFGHLIMGCNKRPDLVGEYLHNRINWQNKRKYNTMNGKLICYYIDPDELFEKVSFDKNDKPISIANPDAFNFSWAKIYNKDGCLNKKVQDIVDTKWRHFKDGKANQADADYFAYKILKDFPQIAKNIANRFPYFIIDEAQDTTEVQMSIIDKLVNEGGLKEILLIGDPDQAIFEWNKARPELFKNKYENEGWRLISHNENRRSSQLICNAANAFKGEKKSIPQADNKAKDYPAIPEIVEYEEKNTKGILKTRDEFLETCSAHSIRSDSSDPHEAKITIVYRSKKFGEHFGFPIVEHDDIPWMAGKYYVRDIVQGKFLYEKGELRKGYKLIEQGYLKVVTQKTYISSDVIQKRIDEKGFRKHRDEIFAFINKLPPCEEKKLSEWLSSAKIVLPSFDFQVNNLKSNIPIKALFNSTREELDEKYHIGTVHSVKGCTFEAVLFFLGNRAGKYAAYSKLFASTELTSEEEEELRIVYVALTRPRRILVLAVPNGEKDLWSKKLGLLN